MVFHVAPALLLGALLTRSEVLSHITRRVVDGFGSAEDQGTMITVINVLPGYPVSALQEDKLTDWLVVPPPDRFILLSGRTPQTCVMGVMLDGAIGDPPAIFWRRVPLDTPVRVELPARALGTFFAEIDTVTDTLNVRQVEKHGSENGHRLFAVRA